MTTSLLVALALPLPARGLPGSGAPPASGGPTGPIRAPGVTPREEVPGPRRPPPPPQPPKPKEPTDAEIAKAKATFAADPAKGAEPLAVLAGKIGDKARRDPIIKALRAGLVKVQPFTSNANARKALDKGLDDLLEKGLKEGFLKVLEATIGKKAVEGKRNDGTPPPGTKPDEAPGEHIVDGPAFDLPGSKPPQVPRHVFRFIGVAHRYKPSKYFDFTVRTPDRFKPDDKRFGATRVIIGPKAQGTSGPKLRDKHLTEKGDVPMTMQAPDEPGTYIMYIFLGTAPEPQPVQEFEVGP